MRKMASMQMRSMIIQCLFSGLVLHSINTEVMAKKCPDRQWPASFGGPADAVVNVTEATKWRKYKLARRAETLEEARSPALVSRRFRLEYGDIAQGCVSLSQLVDVGRALFLRRFSHAEGYGHKLTQYPQRSRLQRGHFGGPDASACVDCHWKGGFAGSGDRVDNTYANGDGLHLSKAEPRNPPSLWGVGWVQNLAEEMSADLKRLQQEASKQAKTEQKVVEVNLRSKGIEFGVLRVDSHGQFDFSSVEGIDHDLVIKPFGWRGVFKSVREFVELSAHKHLGLQSERLVLFPYREVKLGDGNGEDPDKDGVLRELTEGQITALVAFLATLDTPQLEVPTHGLYQVPARTGPLDFVNTPEFVDRWQRGVHLFERIGCTECHKPFLPLHNPVFQTEWYQLDGPKISVGGLYKIDLSELAAYPHPEYQKTASRESHSNTGQWLVPVFSDFKRHKMGEALKGLYSERGVPADTYMTRRLWGLRKTSPYLHHGGALTFEEAIHAHGGVGSEAKEAAEQYLTLNDDEKSSVRLFLTSLSRGPAIRIR